MHTLARNRRDVYYALYTGKERILDANGDFTGEYRLTYGTPVKIRASVSAARGSTSVSIFGYFQNYQHTVITHDMSCPIAESSVLWIDKTPSEGTYNYTVHAVAKGLDHIAYAVTQVDVKS